MKEITWFDNSDGQMNMVLPDETTYGPRDGIRIGSSRDYLFELWLARNLVVHKQSYASLLHCSSTQWNDRGNDIYLFEHNSGTLHHPITLEAIKPDSLRVINRLKIQTAIKKLCRPLIGYKLRAGLYEHFFAPVVEHEDDLADDDSKASSATLKIAGKTIYPSQEPLSDILNQLNAPLLWPLTSGVDPILDNWGERCNQADARPSCDLIRKPLPVIKQLFDFPKKRLPEHNGICPLDGYITTIIAEHRSPDWTWSAMVGRHFRFQLCPHCLRIIDSKLISMS